MIVRVLIATSVAGFPFLTREGLTQLYSAQPELFGHPDEVVNFDDMVGRAHESLEEAFPNCFVDGEKVYFLQMNSPEFRKSAWLLQMFDEGKLHPLLRPPKPSTVKLKVLAIPSDVTWYLDSDDNGSELVREHGRVWS